MGRWSPHLLMIGKRLVRVNARSDNVHNRGGKMEGTHDEGKRWKAVGYRRIIEAFDKKKEMQKCVVEKSRRW